MECNKCKCKTCKHNKYYTTNAICEWCLHCKNGNGEKLDCKGWESRYSGTFGWNNVIQDMFSDK